MGKSSFFCDARISKKVFATASLHLLRIKPLRSENKRGLRRRAMRRRAWMSRMRRLSPPRHLSALLRNSPEFLLVRSTR
jgi:hypothetical protein